jgi:hypothetical protein
MPFETFQALAERLMILAIILIAALALALWVGCSAGAYSVLGTVCRADITLW